MMQFSPSHWMLPLVHPEHTGLVLKMTGEQLAELLNAMGGQIVESMAIMEV